MTKLLTLLLGFGLSAAIGAFLFVGLAFSGEAHRGRPGDATSTLFICLAWAFCLLPAAAAIYKVSADNMSFGLLVLLWILGPAGAAAGAMGYEFFFPKYTATQNSESINSFKRFKNANAEFAKENPETVAGLFKPIFDKTGKLDDDYSNAEDRVRALAKSMDSPIYITQEDGKGDRVILANPSDVDPPTQIFPTTKDELKRLTSGQPVSPYLLKFLASLPPAI